MSDVNGPASPGSGDRRLVEAFAALTAEDGERHLPFRWQMRLLRRLLHADLPQVVDVPTGLGKTAVMALWLIALAEGANLPRRLVYVVDRRAVVDQATRFAERLRRNMPRGLAVRLRLDAGLPISTLRGGFADNRDWLEDPSRPAILVGTIDLVGSRLLFEGYGVSTGMRPYHAGCLGVDALVLLDEAHLCPPFEALLRQVAEHRDEKLGPEVGASTVTPPFRLMSLSATGRDVTEPSSDSAFRMKDSDLEEPIVRQRLRATKRLHVVELTNAQSLTECIADRALALAGHDTTHRVLIYCNSRKDAVEVKKAIDGEYKRRLKSGDLTLGHASELLVGERRVYERTALENWLERHGFLGGATGTVPQVPRFLVATSAGEVGVDLDADHLVCDLVAFERMVQRLGRVNRRGGQDRGATVAVFAVRPELKSNAAKAATEQHKRDLETFKRRLAVLAQLPREDDGRHDASPAALVELKASRPDMIEAATTPAPLHPELTRPLLDSWAMTSLRQHDGRPEVSPWLRGWDEDEQAHTNVAWRTYLPCEVRAGDVTASPAMVAAFFQHAPLHATEKLEALSSRVMDWLLKRAAQIGKRGASNKLGTLAVKGNDIVAIVMDRSGNHVTNANLSELQWLAAPAKNLSRSVQRNRDRRKRDWTQRYLPGETLIVDARMCGLRDGMLDEKCEHEVATADSDTEWKEMKDDPTADSAVPLIGFRLEEVGEAAGEDGLSIPDERPDWRHVRTFETHFDSGGQVRRGLAILKWADDSADEDDRSIAFVPQALRDHVDQVAAHTGGLTEALGLPEDEKKAFAIAARLHDAGKASEHWQNAMNAPNEGRPYAKTRGGGNWRLLEGYRHEFGSLLKAECRDLPDGIRDLILHLIAAHHGNARPVISSAGCEYGPPSALESTAGDAALRFARLQRRYGPWGLAWREAILRAADQSASRAWSQRQRRQGKR